MWEVCGTNWFLCVRSVPFSRNGVLGIRVERFGHRSRDSTIVAGTLASCVHVARTLYDAESAQDKPGMRLQLLRVDDANGDSYIPRITATSANRPSTGSNDGNGVPTKRGLERTKRSMSTLSLFNRSKTVLGSLSVPDIAQVRKGLGCSYRFKCVDSETVVPDLLFSIIGSERTMDLEVP